MTANARTILAKGSALTLVLIVGIAFVIGYRNFRGVMYDFAKTPSADISRHTEQVGIQNLSEVVLTALNGAQVAGWYAPSRNRAAIVITSGTNSDRSSMLDEIRILSEAGFGVLAIDWPGAGRSEGPVCWGDAERKALLAAVDWLSNLPDVDPNRIGGLGFSMGGYMMAQISAIEPRIQAVVLEAAPTDFAEYTDLGHRKWGVVSQWGAKLGLLASCIDLTEPQPIQVVGKIAPRPLLVVGGNKDQVIPPTMTQALFGAANQPKWLWLVQGAGHGGYATADVVGYRLRLTEFFKKWLLESAMTRN
jgi:uncharacterized protein